MRPVVFGPALPLEPFTKQVRQRVIRPWGWYVVKRVPASSGNAKKSEGKRLQTLLTVVAPGTDAQTFVKPTWSWVEKNSINPGSGHSEFIMIRTLAGVLFGSFLALAASLLPIGFNFLGLLLPVLGGFIGWGLAQSKVKLLWQQAVLEVNYAGGFILVELGRDEIVRDAILSLDRAAVQFQIKEISTHQWEEKRTKIFRLLSEVTVSETELLIEGV